MDSDVLKTEAQTDYLTGIWNRRTGEKHIIKHLENNNGALVIVDLDNFKLVNDTYGHLMGDHVLKQVADVLRVIGKNDIVCRMGGDEFLLFLKNATTEEDAKPILDALMESFDARCKKDEMLAQTSLSVGVALSVQDGREFHQLFRCADRALYYIKQNGKSGYSFYNGIEYTEDKNAKLNLEHLVESLHQRDYHKGAYRVEYEKFFIFKEYIEKSAKRNNQNVQLVLLTIDFDKSIPMEFDDRDVIMKELELSVTKALRGTDVCTRFSSDQMMIILVDATSDNVPLTVQRMLAGFYKLHRPSDIKITFDSVDITHYE